LSPDPYKPITYAPIRLSDNVTEIGRHAPKIPTDHLYELLCLLLFLAVVAASVYFQVWNYDCEKFFLAKARHEKADDDIRHDLVVHHTHLTFEVDIISVDGGAKYVLLAILATVLVYFTLCRSNSKSNQCPN